MRKGNKKIWSILIMFFYCVSFYSVPSVNATQIETSSITKATSRGVTLEGENINTTESIKTIYLTVDSTGMENGLAGYSARLQLTPGSSSKHGWIYGTIDPEIEVLTANWEVGTIHFSGWNENSYLDFTIEASDKILNTISKSSAVKIAITFPVATPTSNWGGVEPYTDLSITNTLKRTDYKNNVDTPLSNSLNIRLTENKQSDTGKARVTMSLSERELNKGDTFVVTIGIVGTSTGVSGLQGIWNYNPDIFEYVERNMLFDKWRCTGWNENTGIFLTEIMDSSDSSSYVKDARSIISFTLKVKEDANIPIEGMDETLEVSNLVVSGAEVEETAIRENVRITSISDIQPDPDEPNNPSDVDTPSSSEEPDTSTNPTEGDSSINLPNGNSSDNSSGNITFTNSSDSTTAKEILPKTGKNSIVFLGILLGGGGGCYFYRKYQQYKEL